MNLIGMMRGLKNLRCPDSAQCLLQTCFSKGKTRTSSLKTNCAIMKWLSILPLFLATATFAAENKNPDPTFLDPTTAGPDYRDQGEYKNDWAAHR